MALWVDVKVEGEANLRMRIRAEERQRNEGFLRGMEMAANYLLNKSLPLVPIEYGDLYRSGNVRATGQGHNRQYEIGYDEEYAIFVHENLLAHHPHGQAKFLEQPYRENRAYMQRIVARETARG